MTADIRKYIKVSRKNFHKNGLEVFFEKKTFKITLNEYFAEKLKYE